MADAHVGWLRVEDSIHAQESTRAAMHIRQREAEEWYKQKISSLTQENETMAADLAALSQELERLAPEGSPEGETELASPPSEEPASTLFVSSTAKGLAFAAVMLLLLASAGILPPPPSSAYDAPKNENNLLKIEGLSIPLEEINTGLDKSDPAYFEVAELKGLLQMVGQNLERCSKENEQLNDRISVRSQDLARELADLRETFNILLVTFIIVAYLWYKNIEIKTLVKYARRAVGLMKQGIKWLFTKKQKDESDLQGGMHLLVSRRKSGKAPVVVAAPREDVKKTPEKPAVDKKQPAPSSAAPAKAPAAQSAAPKQPTPPAPKQHQHMSPTAPHSNRPAHVSPSDRSKPQVDYRTWEPNKFDKPGGHPGGGGGGGNRYDELLSVANESGMLPPGSKGSKEMANPLASSSPSPPAGFGNRSEKMQPPASQPQGKYNPDNNYYPVGGNHFPGDMTLSDSEAESDMESVVSDVPGHPSSMQHHQEYQGGYRPGPPPPGRSPGYASPGAYNPLHQPHHQQQQQHSAPRNVLGNISPGGQERIYHGGGGPRTAPSPARSGPPAPDQIYGTLHGASPSPYRPR